MIKIIDFTTEAEKGKITQQMGAEGATLLEVQNHFDGNHLVFDDGLVEPRDPLKEIDNLKDRMAKLEGRG